MVAINHPSGLLNVTSIGFESEVRNSEAMTRRDPLSVTLLQGLACEESTDVGPSARAKVGAEPLSGLTGLRRGGDWFNEILGASRQDPLTRNSEFLLSIHRRAHLAFESA